MEVLDRPEQGGRHHLRRADRGRLPGPDGGVQPTPGVTYYYLFKHGSLRERRGEPVPADDGQRAEAERDAAGLRPAERPADRDDAVHGHGQQGLPRDHAAPRRCAARRSGSTRASRSCSTTSSARTRRSTTSSTRAGSTRPQRRRADHRASPRPAEAKNLALVLQTGALPVKFDTVARTRRLRDARQGLAEAGAERGDRRPDRGRALPAHPVPLPRPRRGARARASTRAFMYAAILIFGVTLTLPGFAGLILTIGVAADANVVIFERIKEEVRVREERARRDRGRLREGLPHDRRRERRRRASPRSSCSGSRPQG